MSEVPKAENSARIILGLFRANNLRPGQPLMLPGLEYRFITGRLGSNDEFKAGLDYATKHKWISLRNDQAFLTPSGFAAMK
jgi:hypothetical protein